MAYKYNKTIMNGAEKLIDGIDNIEMFLGDNDDWNFHDSEIHSFHWDKEKNTFTVAIELIGCEFPEIEKWDGESKVILDLHFIDCIEVHMNQIDFSFPNYISEIEISKCKGMIECWFNGYPIKVTSSRLQVDKPRFL